MDKKKTDKPAPAKPKKVKKPKPDYIYDGNVICRNCEDDNTEIRNGDLICKNCGYIIKGVVICGIIGVVLYFFM